jgi:5-amino-6-(5-phosphoribosylamino)uracil reductase/diaminohydroxyphosphoribosylaminopyrimidine deaminase/5-amino-6-(5-phosphoribosylamino)uracil reductase
MPVHELTPDAAAACWPALLQARSWLERGGSAFALVRSPGGWRCVTQPAVLESASAVVMVPVQGREDGLLDAVPADAACSVFRSDVHGLPMGIEHPTGLPVDAATLACCRLYLPVLLGMAAARAQGRTFVTAHLAQSLDGRIACVNGQSRWIGNDADLQHGHRLRALHAAVLVGGRTVLRDDPQLTVRLVPGPQPRRVVLSASASLLGGHHRVLREAGCLLLTTAEGLSSRTVPPPVVAQVLAGNGHIAGEDVCRALWQQGLGSVYVEGGGVTVSAFLEDRCIDLLHVHLAPLLLGAGVPAFTLPEVASVGDGVHLRTQHFLLDGHLLYECTPRNGAART